MRNFVILKRMCGLKVKSACIIGWDTVNFSCNIRRGFYLSEAKNVLVTPAGT